MTRTCRKCGVPSGTFVFCRPCARPATAATDATPLPPESGGGVGRQAALGGVLSVACTWQRPEMGACPAHVCGARSGDACSFPALFTYDSVRAVIVRDVNDRPTATLVHESRHRDWGRSR